MNMFSAFVLAGVASVSASASWAADVDVTTLEKAARTEGQVNSVGMPDNWANWKATWQQLTDKYAI